MTHRQGLEPAGSPVKVRYGWKALTNIISGLATEPSPNFQNTVTISYVPLIDFKNVVAFGNNDLVLKLPLMSSINSRYLSYEKSVPSPSLNKDLRPKGYIVQYNLEHR